MNRRIIWSHFLIRRGNTSVRSVENVCTIEETVKRSKFKAIITRVDSWIEAKEFLARIRDPSANHNCYAFRGLHDWKCSDDGEPVDSAGRPILTAIEHAGLHNVMIVVQRYFGGIKLGSSGLYRAYYSAAMQATLKATKVEIVESTSLMILIKAVDVGEMYSVFHNFNITLGDNANKNTNDVHKSHVNSFVSTSNAETSDLISAVVKVPVSQVDDLSNKLRTVCKGNVSIQQLGDWPQVTGVFNLRIGKY